MRRKADDSGTINMNTNNNLINLNFNLNVRETEQPPAESKAPAAKIDIEKIKRQQITLSKQKLDKPIKAIAQTFNVIENNQDSMQPSRNVTNDAEHIQYQSRAASMGVVTGKKIKVKTIRGVSPRLREGIISGSVGLPPQEQQAIKPLVNYDSVESSPVRAFQAPTPKQDAGYLTVVP
jgi:hypothetical protein